MEWYFREAIPAFIEEKELDAGIDCRENRRGTLISETLLAGLAEYRIGPKVRALRAGKDMDQIELARHTGLSPALLSKIERGQLFPTLPTLLRIALVFGVGLDYFFISQGSRRSIAITRKAERLSLPDRPGDTNPSYLFQSLNFPATDRKMEAYYAEFPSHAEPSKPHRHSGTELLYMLRGCVDIDVDGEVITLSEGDAIQFEAKVMHSYHCQSHRHAAAIVVVVT
jgi:transcriptional regulator with XRE-family HTH domain